MLDKKEWFAVLFLTFLTCVLYAAPFAMLALILKGWQIALRVEVFFAVGLFFLNVLFLVAKRGISVLKSHKG